MLHRGKPQEVKKWSHYLWHLVTGVRCLEIVSSTVFRVVDLANFNPENYQKGKIVAWRTFSSCSFCEEKAKSFLQVF